MAADTGPCRLKTWLDCDDSIVWDKASFNISRSYLSRLATVYGEPRPWECRHANKLVIIGPPHALLTHLGQDKMTDISRRHFQTYYVQEKCLNFD